jgi:hypothetical protein
MYIMIFMGVMLVCHLVINYFYLVEFLKKIGVNTHGSSKYVWANCFMTLIIYLSLAFCLSELTLMQP